MTWEKVSLAELEEGDDYVPLKDYSGIPAIPIVASPNTSILRKRNKRRRLLWCGTFALTAVVLIGVYWMPSRQHAGETTVQPSLSTKPIQDVPLSQVPVPLSVDGTRIALATDMTLNTTERALSKFETTNSHSDSDMFTTTLTVSLQGNTVASPETNSTSFVHHPTSGSTMQPMERSTEQLMFDDDDKQQDAPSLPIWAASPSEKQRMVEEFLDAAFL